MSYFYRFIRIFYSGMKLNIKSATKTNSLAILFFVHLEYNKSIGPEGLCVVYASFTISTTCSECIEVNAP